MGILRLKLLGQFISTFLSSMNGCKYLSGILAVTGSLLYTGLRISPRDMESLTGPNFYVSLSIWVSSRSLVLSIPVVIALDYYDFSSSFCPIDYEEISHTGCYR